MPPVFWLIAVGVLALSELASGESLRITPVLSDLERFRDQLASYHASKGSYPSRLTDLPGVDRQPQDSWGEPYIYRTNRDGYVLYSTGKNAMDDGGRGDDVISYEELDLEFYPELRTNPLVYLVLFTAAAVPFLVARACFRRAKGAF